MPASKTAFTEQEIATAIRTDEWPWCLDAAVEQASEQSNYPAAEFELKMRISAGANLAAWEQMWDSLIDDLRHTKYLIEHAMELKGSELVFTFSSSYPDEGQVLAGELKDWPGVFRGIEALSSLEVRPYSGPV